MTPRRIVAPRARRTDGRLRARVPFAIVLALLCAAPTVGDVGSCTSSPDPLDAHAFFASRLAIECRKCGECDLRGTTCAHACDARIAIPSSFPDGCHPLVHDGEVCLRAIDALGCDDFADLVSATPIVPTECDFCPASLATPAPTTPTTATASVTR